MPLALMQDSVGQLYSSLLQGVLMALLSDILNEATLPVLENARCNCAGLGRPAAEKPPPVFGHRITVAAAVAGARVRRARRTDNAYSG